MKAKRVFTGAAVMLVAAAMLAGGCGPDPKERIALLEENNAALTDQLNRMQGDLLQAQAERDACDRDLALSRAENSDLQGRLAETPVEPSGETPAGWTAVPGGAMIAIEGWALFDAGKPTIQDGSKPILDEICRALQGNYADKDVLVFGHTDNQPIKVSGWKDNWELSSQRALSVVRYLASRGVSAERLAACGCGEHRPRMPNDSARAQQKNRRVEIYVLDPAARSGSTQASRR